MKVKEESKKLGLKLNIQKTKIMASGPITSWEINGETVETVSDFLGVQNHCRWWLQPWPLKLQLVLMFEQTINLDLISKWFEQF